MNAPITNLVELAEAVFDGRVKYLDPTDGVKYSFMRVLGRYRDEPCWNAFQGPGMSNDGHRMWFCLLVHEATKGDA